MHSLSLPSLRRLLACLCVSLFASNSAWAVGAGSLDSLDLGMFGSSVIATAVQPDGKIILGGNFTSVLGQPRNGIARLNADGTLDMGFDPNVAGIVFCVAVQADGKILLGGDFFALQPNGAASPTTRNRVARVNADGTLDTGFDPNAADVVYGVAVQADGKILLGGVFTTLQPNGAASPTARNYIARVNADGTLDTGFDPNAAGPVFSVALQPDGKILLGGAFINLQPNGAASPTPRKCIARVNPDGTLDTGFDPNPSTIVFCVAVQADGKILLGGDFSSLQPNGAASPTTRNCIARVNADGTLDAGFDPNAAGPVFSVALQADGKILLGGFFTSLQPNGAASPTTRNHIARVNADGTLDMGFDPNADALVYGVAAQADGRVLVMGEFTTLQPNGAASPTTRNFFARLENDPASQVLSAPSAAQVLWTRGGSAPEVSRVTFELSTNGGVSYTPLAGTATRVGTTANWQLGGLSLPGSGRLRARGHTPGAFTGGSSGLIEQVLDYSLAPASAPTAIVAQGGVPVGQLYATHLTAKKVYALSGSVITVAEADALLAGAGVLSSFTGPVSKVDFADLASDGNFPGYQLFPGESVLANIDGFALQVTGKIVVPTSGTYTFGTLNDDGVRLRVDGSDVIVDGVVHASQEFYGSVVLTAGEHSIELTFFEDGGGAVVELYAAPGSFSSFDSSMKLVEVPPILVTEGVPASTVIATLQGVDADVGDTHTFTLVSGMGDADNAAFTLTSAGVLSINASPSYATKSLYNLRVRVTDQGGLSYDQALIVQVVPSISEIDVFRGSAAGTALTDNGAVQSFGSVNVTASGAAQTFTIQNSGTANLTGLAVSSTSGEFVVNTTGMSTTLAPEARTSFTVTFSPTSTGSRTAVLNIASNDADENPFEINVSGTGVEASASSTFSNTSVMDIPLGQPGTSAGAASIYPSTITVSGVTGTVSKVVVKLNGLTHSWVTDLNILLVGPGGETCLLMNQVGGLASSANVTLDDSAASSLSVGTPNLSGSSTFKPSSSGFSTTLSAPAPVGPYGSTLAGFNGVDPNGVWSLYVFDTASGDVGTLAGWEVSITTAGAALPELAVESPAGTVLTDNDLFPVVFGTTDVGESLTRTFRVRNTGMAVLNLTGVTFSGTAAEDYTTSLTTPTTVAAGSQVDFTVTFAPRTSRERNAIMQIASDDTDVNPFDVRLRGYGTADLDGLWSGGAPLMTLPPGQSMDVSGLNITTDLSFVPNPGQSYTFIEIQGALPSKVLGNFNDLPEGGVVAMAYNGTIYYFQAYYESGMGSNDLVLTNFTPSAPPAWAWVKGPKARNGAGIHGTQGDLGASNNPGARQGAMQWRDPDGSLWLFGGYGYGSSVTSNPRYLNDLWKYDRSVGQWVWVSGAKTQNAVSVYAGLGDPTNTPGARHTGSTWTDDRGNLWLFGGLGATGRHNDLWQFTGGNWELEKGTLAVGQAGVYADGDPANLTPGARQGATAWFTPGGPIGPDAVSGTLWLFGGTTNGTTQFLNDLWRYDLGTGNWTLVSGSAAVNQNGVYGTQGSAGAGNVPGARRIASSWVGQDGSLWLFGGQGLGELATSGASVGDLNDLWRYNPVSGQWTWVRGSKGLNAAGSYGTKNVAAAGNEPPARGAGGAWSTVDGKFWLVGGMKNLNAGPVLNDVWIFDPGSGNWTWYLGSATPGAAGSYGTLGTAGAGNEPGARFTPSTWVTVNGNLWVFGGGGVDGFGNGGRLSDLWTYGIPAPAGAPALPDAEPFPAAMIVNNDPNVGDQSAGTMAYTPVSGQLGGSDPDGDRLLFSSSGVTATSQGTLTLNEDGSWSYTPAYGFTGTASFSFQAGDHYGGESPVRSLTITVSPNPLDADGDGIADAYELERWGSLALADGAGDADQDGQSNYFEFLAGTDPLDAGQVLSTAPSVAGEEVGGGRVRLGLNHVRPGVSYHLEVSGDLELWQRVGTFTFESAGSAEIEAPVSADGAPRFYRMNLEGTPSALLP